MKSIRFSARSHRKTLLEDKKDNLELMKLFKQVYKLEHKKIPMFNTEYAKGETNYEDSSMTNYISQKILFVGNLKVLLAISLMFIGYFAYIFEFDQTKSESVGKTIYIWVTILTLLIITTSIIESYLVNLRNREKKILQETETESSLVYFLKIIFYIIHPNIIFYRHSYNKEYAFNGSYDVPTFERNFNEYLYMFQFTFLYFIISKMIINNSIWANDGSDRITRMVGFRISILFLIKCLMRESRKTVSLAVLVGTLFYYTLMLKVVEGPLYKNEAGGINYVDLAYPGLTFWNAYITFFTIGYGDYAVSTYFGRIYISFLCVIAGIVLSFITVAMTIDFDFGDSDKKAFVLLNSVELKKEVDVSAAMVIKAFFRLKKAERNGAQLEVIAAKHHYDVVKRNFSSKLNEYKNTRTFDVYSSVYKSLCTFEDRIEEDEARYEIEKTK